MGFCQRAIRLSLSGKHKNHRTAARDSEALRELLFGLEGAWAWSGVYKSMIEEVRAWSRTAAGQYMVHMPCASFQTSGALV